MHAEVCLQRPGWRRSPSRGATGPWPARPAAGSGCPRTRRRPPEGGPPGSRSARRRTAATCGRTPLGSRSGCGTKSGSTCMLRSSPVAALAQRRAFPFRRWSSTVCRYCLSQSLGASSVARRIALSATRFGGSSSESGSVRPFSLARTNAERPTQLSRSEPTSRRRKSRSAWSSTLLPITLIRTSQSRAYCWHWR
jgi:hypothetical protein